MWRAGAERALVVKGLISWRQMIPMEDDSGIESAYSDDGVDLTLIRWMLSLTPAERLETLQQYVNSVVTIRARNSQTRLSADPARFEQTPS